MSNHSWSESLVVPAPTNWRACGPRWSPAPLPWASWLANVTLSVSGLNCTRTQRSWLIVCVKSLLSSRSSARSSRAGSGTARPPQGQRLVGELQLLDRHRPVLGVQRRGLELDRQAALEDEAGALGDPVLGQQHDLAVRAHARVLE